MKSIIALSVLFGSGLCFEKYNYRLSGEDWTMGQCGAAKSPRQSPINIPKQDSPDSSLLRVANNMKVIMWMGTHETCLLHNGMYDDTVQGEEQIAQIKMNKIGLKQILGSISPTNP
jgi:hypothetical protein